MAEREGKPDIGAVPAVGGGVRFRVWAPLAETVSVKILSGLSHGDVVLERSERGYFEAVSKGAREGDRYLFVLDGKAALPDPSSRFQPEGVHGPSEVVDPHKYSWHDDGWKGVALQDLIIYELHVGTFTREGTFDGAAGRLDYLTDLGVTAIELMPVSQFPGNRDWGYDGVYPFAPQNTYGGPNGLKRLIDSCHAKGLAVILDVVYNHLGPEGNYLGSFGPYFTDRYKTPWGEAINFDGPYSDEVRHYFVANALYWIDEYHVDALRIDAVQGVFDFSAHHFLRELAEAVDALQEGLGRTVHLIAESDLNDARLINEPEIGGYGIAAQWNDDFHHALHTLITGEGYGYYADFGALSHLAKAFSEGFVYSGQYSNHRKRRHGSSSRHRPPSQFIVFSQNHDQVASRIHSDRLSATEALDRLKLAAATVLLSPYVPLLFMGEEYGERSPFYYFVNFGDRDLAEAVRKGRTLELMAQGQEEEAADPQDEATFRASKIDPDGAGSTEQRMLLQFYRKLILLRRATPALASVSRECIEVNAFDDEKALVVRRWSDGEQSLCLYGFGDTMTQISLLLPAGGWDKILDSSAETWGGHGSLSPDRVVSDGTESIVSLNPFSLVVYLRRRPE